MRARLVAVAALVSAACAACGSAGDSKVTAQIVGGQARERALAREILAKLEPSPVTRVRFMGYQHDAKHHWPGRRMDVTHSPDSVEADWEESVFAYSYALLARSRHVPIGYVSLDIGNGLLDSALASAPHTPVDASHLHAFESRLRAAAKAAGVAIAFRELRPGPVALEATVTTRRPASFLEHRLDPFHDLWQHRPDDLLGLLFSVDDPSGVPAFAAGESPAGSTAGGTLFPECVEASWPFAFSPPAGTTFPRCPAAEASAASVDGGTPAQRQLARRITRALAPSKLVSIRFDSGELLVHGTDRSIRSTWEEQLFGVSFVRAAERLGVKRPGSIATDEETGPVEEIDSARPSRAALRHFIAAFRASARASRASIVAVRVLRPEVIAVRVTLRVPDPAAFLKHRSNRLVGLVDSAPTGVYGTYLGLVDARGRIFFELSRLANEGGYHIRPDLYSCSPVSTYDPPEHPPPCRA